MGKNSPVRHATCHSLAASCRGGFAYAVIVFACGCVLGAIRLFLLAPRVGATIAVLAEAPLMLAASWWISRVCIAHFRVPAQLGARIVMGGVAFVTLLLAEFALSTLVFGRLPAAYVSSLVSTPGAIGLGAQIVFALFPLVQARALLPGLRARTRSYVRSRAA
jgi:hypothetical protein